MSARFREIPERFGRRDVRVVEKHAHQRFVRRQARAGRPRAATILAAEQAARQRKIREEAEPVREHRRHEFALDVAREQTVFVLARDDCRAIEALRRPHGFGHLPRGEVRNGGVADFSLRNQVVERADRLFDRRERIGRVHEIEIDPIRLQPAQTRIDGRHDVAARGSAQQSRSVHRQTELRRDDDVGAPPAERVAEQFFRLAGRVERVAIGRVEERDAVRERCLHDVPRRRRIEPAAEIVAAETDGRDAQPRGAEIAQVH